MKTLIVSLIAALPLTLGAIEEKGDKSLTAKTTATLEKAGEKTAATLEKAGEKTKEAGEKVIDGTKKVASTAVDAITPDADAHKVDVKLGEGRLDLPRKLSPGKTGFVIHNNGKVDRNFEIQGEGIDKKLWLSVPPNETKVLHVDLKPGSYKAFCPDQKGMSAEISVK
ncbi:MAG TPA: hypothetical protein VGO11_09500 [Chthoniobacteraceae bacterium]|nr:hypothetical protein [Chthoniobacteraceae bacterium]